MSLDRDGYGRIRVPGRGRVRVHRLALAQRVDGAGLVCHTCHNPACLNYRHLYWGDERSNYRDCRLVGRNIRGRRVHCAKLTDEAVLAIRRRYAHGGVSQQVLADEFGVSQNRVSKIVRGRCWVHVGQKAS